VPFTDTLFADALAVESFADLDFVAIQTLPV